MLANVRAANLAAERARAEAEEHAARLVEMERELKRKLVSIEEARRQVLEQAREEGRRELERLRSEVKRLRSGLLEQGQTTLPVQQVTQEVDKLLDELPPIAPTVVSAPVSTQRPQVGDTVFVSTLGQAGELLSLNGTEAEVRVGGFRLRTRSNAIEFRSRPAPRQPEQDNNVRTPLVESPGIELDMRGWRAEEVAPQLDRYLDNAYMAGLPWVNIIHGKGMGILKEVVRQFLANHPLVESYRTGNSSEGGEGVTVVQLHKRHS